MADQDSWKITKHRSVRIEDDLWEGLKPAAEAIGQDRSGVIRQFVRWYLRIPGAKLPQRPEPKRRVVERHHDPETNQMVDGPAVTQYGRGHDATA